MLFQGYLVDWDLQKEILDRAFGKSWLKVYFLSLLLALSSVNDFFLGIPSTCSACRSRQRTAICI